MNRTWAWSLVAATCLVAAWTLSRPAAELLVADEAVRSAVAAMGDIMQDSNARWRKLDPRMKAFPTIDWSDDIAKVETSLAMFRLAEARHTQAVRERDAVRRLWWVHARSPAAKWLLISGVIAGLMAFPRFWKAAPRPHAPADVSQGR